MPLDTPPVFFVADIQGPMVTLRSPTAAVAHVFVLEHDILRVMVLPSGNISFASTWAICPGGDEVASHGRDRFDLRGFSLPAFDLKQDNGQLIITTGQLRLSLKLAGLFCHWESKIAGVWQTAAVDRQTQAYNFGWWDQRVYHYLQRFDDEMYFGLGERAGATNRAGQSYEMRGIDAMGYNARTTDPLYKHIPFYLTWRTSNQAPLGLFYDTLSDCRFDMGRELDNYHGPYRSFIAEHGDLDYYVIAGGTLAHVTRRFTWLTGQPAMMPRWSLGYSGSTMSYTDAPDAQTRMNEFLEKCAEHDIMCESFHLSSGYTSIADKRYVFHWNREKFPDPAGFAEHFLKHGVRLCPNIKPCLLVSHPKFAEVAEAGLFIHEPDGSPALVQFWDEVGAYLDFTNPATSAWWQQQVTEALLKHGLAATWNDNNEFEIWNDRARSHGFGVAYPAIHAKPLQTLLMIQASQHAQKAFAPTQRPFLVTRAGVVGMQRYAQTWSGDNFTSWETLKYNIKMGIGLALSGVSNTGHDIGGFAGPAPEPELLLRWVQFGIFLPRFSIHSWNSDHTVNEPWMFPDITPAISALIKLRARLTPYFYDLMWKSHTAYEPMIRPTFYDFPHDPLCFAENDEMMLGATLLVVPVVEPGHRTRLVYLPAGDGWYDYNTGDYHPGGQTVTLAAGLNWVPLLVRAGSVIPLNGAEQHFNQPRDQRTFAVYPHHGTGQFRASFFDDDGQSANAKQGLWQVSVHSDAATISVIVEVAGDYPLPLSEVTIELPAQETRSVMMTLNRSSLA